MEHLNERLRTFEEGGWFSHAILPLPPPFVLATAGFFYLGNGDRVKCFACGGEMMSLNRKMCPFTAHVTYFETCTFVKEEVQKNRTLCKSDDCMCPKEPTSVISDLPSVDDRE